MEQSTPHWLTVEFLQQCLQNEKRYNQITITSFKVSLAAPAGNNYGGLVLRVNIDYRQESFIGKLNNLAIIIKSPVDLLKDASDCEPMFYKTYIPEAYKLYDYTFAPKSYFCPDPSVIVLEDLKDRGYLMADRTKQLDFEHCKLYMIAAASFHAGSVGVQKTNHKLINAIGKQKWFSYDRPCSDIFQNMAKLQLECFANHIPNTRHSKLVRDFAYDVWDILIETHKPCELINTLNQGDPWTTNMMFRYDKSGKVCDIKLLDFQMLMYTSPLHDLMFFIWSSAQHEVRKHKLSELYQIYFDHFNKVLKQLEYTETITFKAFLEEVHRMTPTILWVVSYAPIRLNPSATDHESLFSKSEQYNSTSENPLEQYYTDSFCQNHLSQLLDEMEQVGVFDYLGKIQQS